MTGTGLSPLWAMPFAGVLGSLAIGPALAPALWHRHYGKVVAAWTLAFLIPFAAIYGAGETLHQLAHALFLEYLPFVIVRSRAKEYGTANRIEGAYEHGACACLVEDVVTSGGAAIEAVEALREAGLRVSNAVCVVDREEGGVDALARAAVRLRALFTASELRESAAKPHG